MAIVKLSSSCNVFCPPSLPSREDAIGRRQDDMSQHKRTHPDGQPQINSQFASKRHSPNGTLKIHLRMNGITDVVCEKNTGINEMLLKPLGFTWLKDPKLQCWRHDASSPPLEWPPRNNKTVRTPAQWPADPVPLLTQYAATDNILFEIKDHGRKNESLPKVSARAMFHQLGGNSATHAHGVPGALPPQHYNATAACARAPPPYACSLSSSSSISSPLSAPPPAHAPSYCSDEALLSLPDPSSSNLYPHSPPQPAALSYSSSAPAGMSHPPPTLPRPPFAPNPPPRCTSAPTYPPYHQPPGVPPGPLNAPRSMPHSQSPRRSDSCHPPPYQPHQHYHPPSYPSPSYSPSYPHQPLAYHPHSTAHSQPPPSQATGSVWVAHSQRPPSQAASHQAATGSGCNGWAPPDYLSDEAMLAALDAACGASGSTPTGAPASSASSAPASAASAPALSALSAPAISAPGASIAVAQSDDLSRDGSYESYSSAVLTETQDDGE